MRLSALFEEFLTFLRVEREAAPRSIETYRWCFRDFEAFTMREVGGTVLVVHFTAERCRAYQYALAARGLKANTIRVRLATLGSFAKWAVRREKLDRNPLDLLTRPRRKARLPRVPRWDTIERLLAESTDPRERAIVALMAYGGFDGPKSSPSISVTTRRSSVYGVFTAKAGSERPFHCPGWRGASLPNIPRRNGTASRARSRCSSCGISHEGAPHASNA